jgi:antitoxin FitA
MSKMIQIRNVPDDVARRLKARAALEGQALSDYLKVELDRIVARPTLTELRERLAGRGHVRPRTSPARAVREERDRA